MTAGRIVIVSGPPGSGKTTVSALLARNSSFPQAVHLHTDDFYSAVVKGLIAPWLPEASKQNQAIASAAAACAEQYARGGLEVIVDGIVGHWLLDPWRAKAAAGVDVHYVVLSIATNVLLERVLARPLGKTRVHPQAVESMAQQFAAPGPYQRYALPTAGLSVADTAAAIQSRVNDSSFRL